MSGYLNRTKSLLRIKRQHCFVFPTIRFGYEWFMDDEFTITVTRAARTNEKEPKLKDDVCTFTTV